MSSLNGHRKCENPKFEEKSLNVQALKQRKEGKEGIDMSQIHSVLVGNFYKLDGISSIPISNGESHLTVDLPFLIFAGESQDSQKFDEKLCDRSPWAPWATETSLQRSDAPNTAPQ